MPSFNLEVVRDAFLASVQPPVRPASSSEDEFEDALSDLEENTHAAAVPTSSKSQIVHAEDFVDALEYSKGFMEIAQFFKFLNVAFQFVGKNVESSCEFITLVAGLHEQESGVSLEQTLEYDDRAEGKYGIISCVMWLHRPLQFILMLFRELSFAAETDTTADITKRCYLATLGRHHAWPIQQMVGVLLSTLPERQDVISMMNLTDDEEANSLLLQVCDSGQEVYDRVERMVTRLDLHDKC